MSFDKTKAMRNAERFLAQGKIRAAINEYKRVVEHDSKDYGTLNMLGDLHAKASDKEEAVKCFTQVAEYYSTQGFAQKAIAIYNKISRLIPDSLEVSAKLAQLYQMKGSVAEARSHYTVLANEYNRTGRKAEALHVWKQIATLDPNNTDIYLKIADACWQEEQKEEAATAYIEAGSRLSAKKQFEPAITAYARALEINKDDLPALKGLVNAQFNLGYADEAAKLLEDALERQPYNREIIFLLVDCYLDMNNPAEAEKAVIRLVEREPANYPKLLDVVQAYLRSGDLKSASRILTMTSEHMLVGGQAEEFERWINEVLARNPEEVDALRLLVRYHGWQRDEAELKNSLERLAEAAKLNEAVDDERYALSQLIIISPQSSEFAERWQELNRLYGNSETYYENLIPPAPANNEVPTFESFAVLGNENESQQQNQDVYAEYGEMSNNYAYEVSGNDFNQSDLNNYQYPIESFEPTVVEELSVTDFAFSAPEVSVESTLNEFEQDALKQELESVDFYVTQGYKDLADKSLNELESRFGSHPEIVRLRATNNSDSTVSYTHPEPSISFGDVSETPAEQFQITYEMPEPQISIGDDAGVFNPLEDFKNELGLEESEPVEEEGDYETHYQLGTAYKEMGLMEDAIRELQDAFKFVSPNDGTRRFFLCCNLLGHCFMEKQMPNLALMWFKRCLEPNNLAETEIQGMRYELANAYEEGGDTEKAIEFFESIYAVNVDYRDVGERLDNLREQ